MEAVDEVDTASAPAGGGTTTLEEAMALLSGWCSPVAHRRAAIEEKRKEAVKQRMELTRELRNEGRKRQRVMQKGRELSEEEMLELVEATARVKSKAVAKKKASAKGKAVTKCTAVPKSLTKATASHKGVSADVGAP